MQFFTMVEDSASARESATMRNTFAVRLIYNGKNPSFWHRNVCRKETTNPPVGMPAYNVKVANNVVVI